MRARTFWPERTQRVVVGGALALLLIAAFAPSVLADQVVRTQAYSAIESQFLVDTAHGFTFMASRDRFITQPPVRHLEVFDADGTSLATFEGGATGMALTATRLFVSSMGSATIRRFDVTQPVPTELTPLTIESIYPNSLVMAGGTLWMAECFPTNPSVFTIDPQTGAQAAVTIGQLDVSNCAEFTDHPTNADVLYAWSKRGGNLYRIDVSGGTFSSTATWSAPGGAAITDVAISADGATLIASVMNGSPNAGAVVLNPTTLAATGVRYDEGHNLRAVAIASDGHVATSGGASVRVFPSGVTTPNAQWATDTDCTGGENTFRGLAFGPSPTELFVATEGQTVHLFSNPTSTLASSSVTASVTPETPFVDDTYTVQGTLNVPGASSSGRTITVRVGGTVVGTTTTGAGGTYSLPITSTVSHQTCVDVRFAGTTSVTGAMAADGVQVLQVPTTLVFDQPTDQLPNAELELTGSLAFDDAASTAGSSVLVERYEDGPWVPVDTATVAGDGTWSVQTTLGAESETFRATYDGTARYAADTESVGVNVGQHVTSLTFRVTNDRVTYGRPPRSGPRSTSRPPRSSAPSSSCHSATASRRRSWGRWRRTPTARRACRSSPR